MIINHNMNAMAAHRQMGINTGNQGKSIEKLSSGQRINRAGDDAAGLAISEKMRGQIRGLDGASTNAQDGISLIQTAEGALNETHNMLQRMRELSVQGANDTNVTEDREAIQKEMDELAKEINRISEQTEFNGQKLLNDDFKGKKLQIGANTDQSLEINIEDMGVKNLGVGTDKVTTSSADLKIGLTTSKLATETKITINSKEVTLAKDSTVDDIVKTLQDAGLEGIKITKDSTSSATEAKMKIEFESIDSTKTLTASGTGVTLGTPVKVEKDEINGLNISDHTNATAAITTIDNAIKKVSGQRAGMGALQNRLEHTIATNDNSAENLQAAESRIRDVDMAKEMMSLSKNNVLVQAAQSMLGQANQQPNQVLSLLR